MRNGLQIFQNQQFGQIRVVELEQPYFVGRDVASALGYKNPVAAMTQHVDNEDSVKYAIPDNQGLSQNTTLINESGVYSLVFGSKLETAKAFKRWVTSEVLPMIRKHGGYLTQEKLTEALTNPDTLIQLATQLKSERAEKEYLRVQNELNEQQLRLSQPKVEYYEKVLQSDSLIATNVIADQLGVSAKRLNEMLQKEQVIYRQNDTFVLFAKYRGKGYEGYRTHTYISNSTGQQMSRKHLYWTEKGCEFITNLFYR